MTKLKPIIEDFGDGYVVFCPKCLSRLGWITDDIKKCPECHTEIEKVMTDKEALEIYRNCDKYPVEVVMKADEIAYQALAERIKYGDLLSGILSKWAIFKGKVADEPDEWVQGYLMKNDCIFQVKEHKGSKCCGFGMFQVDPETVVQVTEEMGNGGR